MKKVVFGIVILLAVIHQDFWWWGDKTLQFGFIPTGLLYHAIFSCMAAGIWFAATKFAWPSEIEAWAESSDEAHDSKQADGLKETQS